MFSYLIGRQDCFGFAFSSSNQDVPQQRYLNDVFILSQQQKNFCSVDLGKTSLIIF